MKSLNKRWLWDIECYPNLFLICAKNVETKERKTYQVSPLGDDRISIANWLKNDVEEMVGFNSINYDYPMLHYALTDLWSLKGREFCERLHKHSKDLIRGKNMYLDETDYIRKQIDLFKINHFDNKAKMTSLKLLEFNLKLDNIQELPYNPEVALQPSEIKEVIEYCDNDVDATELVYNATLSEIELREKLSPQYGIDFTNYNSTKIGENILISKIIKELGEHKVYRKYMTDRGERLEIINTPRESIALKDVIFDYVTFTTKPFKKLLEWFKSKVIIDTNGVFSNIPVEELKVIEGYYATEKLAWNATKEQMVMQKMINTKNELKTLNIKQFNLQYDFGVGGLHACVPPGIYESDDEYTIIDVDVTSFYPNLAIKNKIYPKHYGPEFCDIYESIYKERKKYNKKQFPAENLALKLSLNGAYGKSNSSYSALYDPFLTMSITINGQMSLLMLSERFHCEIPDIQTLQVNTDGTTVRVKRKYVSKLYEICRRWESYTKLQLEDVVYKKMIIKDVNNYISLKEDGGVKRKGAAFIYRIGPGELELHKNFSMLVIPKALEAYFTKGISPEEFIKNHDDIYDFFKRTKIKRSDKLFFREYDKKGNILMEEELQRVTRYIISGYIEEEKYKVKSETSNRMLTRRYYHNRGHGRTLIKEMPPLKGKTEPRNNNVEAGYLCSVFNDLNGVNKEYIKSLIYHQYYVDEVYKVINLIESDNKV